jgi:hypothetical protein
MDFPASGSHSTSPKRTAVLAVHGIGSQRALETVRGVAAAILKKDTRIWVHPEKSGVDVDLSVLTANGVDTTEGPRDVDFHELYWAHLMSETRAVAVLLWLFELVRKGPLLRKGMNAIWWGIAAFLATAVASVTLMLLHGIQRFSEVLDEVSALLLAPLFVICTAITYAALAATIQRAWRIAALALLSSALLIAFLHFGLNYGSFNHYTDMFFPPLIAALIILVAMGRRGLLVWSVVYVIINISLMVVQNARYQVNWDRSDIIADILKNHWIPFFTPTWQPFEVIWHQGWIAWSMTEHWSTTIACWTVVLYFGLNAVFLQSYLGDAARYFRNSPGNVAVRREIRKQAVSTLASLHESGQYDRIIVVAHSLGSVIAYDMLRTYFSRICNDLPNPGNFADTIEQLDGVPFDESLTPDALQANRDRFRDLSRSLVDSIARYPSVLDDGKRKRRVAKWLVTDFVTLGSPLTHAKYLMCNGDTRDELDADFTRRVNEREFPTCPPQGKNRLVFQRDADTAEFHHGAVFAFTRWTNIFFPLKQLFWGDAVGGPLGDLFGRFIEDVRVKDGSDMLLSHTHYWDVSQSDGWQAPCIRDLEGAVNLTDKIEATEDLAS